MNYRIFNCIIFFTVLTINSQTNIDKINVRGKITNNGSAIAGAVITLSGQNLKDTTNADGTYLITKNSVSVVQNTQLKADKISFNKGVLEISLQNSSPVAIEVFDVKGNLIKKEVSNNTAAGMYHMNIGAISNASELLVIRAKVGRHSINARYLSLQNGCMVNTIIDNVASATGNSLAKITAISDTLKIVKNGFITKTVAITSYDTTVNISIDSSNNTTTFAEDAGLDCQVGSPSGSNGGASTVLPDPFTKWDGTQVKNMADWRCRRRELVVQVEKQILGQKAPPPAKIGGSVTGSITKTTYTVSVKNSNGSCTFSGTVSVPASAKLPCPAVVVIGGFNSLNSDVLSSEGIATISYDAYGIASEASGNFTTGKYYDANPDMKGKTGALVAWSWGVSRIIDMIEKNPGVIDPTKMAIHGCSRFGKAAFVIGAFDQRIALGLPLEPGTGGPAPLRALPVFGGQTLAGCNGEASWFGPMSKSYSSSMPVDMSDVAVMYAPRGLLMMDNPHIDHLSYKANFLGCAAAAEVYTAMGKQDALWYLGNSGNGSHCATRAEYGAALRAMIKKFLKDDNSATTGGLDKHSKHGTIDVAGWTKSWKKGTISE